MYSMNFSHYKPTNEVSFTWRKNSLRYTLSDPLVLFYLIFIFIGCTANKEGDQIIKEGGDGNTVVNKCFKQKNI